MNKEPVMFRPHILAILALSLGCILGIAWVVFRSIQEVHEAEKLYMGTGVLLIEYAKRHEGLFPLPEACRHGLRLPETSTLNTAFVTSGDFFYLGYVVRSEADLDAVLSRHFGECDNPEGGLGRVSSGNAERGSDDEITRLSLNFHAIPKPNEVPVLVERPTTESKSCRVLYLDNHVEFITYPGRFPLTARTVDMLNEWELRHRGPIN